MKIRDLMAILMLGVMMSGCTTTSVTNETTTTLEGVGVGQSTVSTTQPDAVTAANDATFEDYLIKYKQKRIFRDNNSIPDRASYGISAKIFDLLPSVPNDFLYKVYMIKYGRFLSIDQLGPEYYKQPEFDPDFTKFGLRYWEEWKEANYSKKHWGTVGIRSYPYSQHVISQPGYSFNVTLFISSNWNIETFQGIRLIPTFIGKATSEDGKDIVSAKDGARFINVNITPNEFLLTPAFPQFTPEWVKRVTITGKIADNTPKGVYIISMKLEKPSTEQSDKWLLEYLNLYSDGAEMVNTDRPYLQAFIYVQ
jgi:hypothetical protein